MVRCWWLGFLISLGACFSPSFNDNAIQCGANGACPPGLDCVAGVCRSDGTTPPDGTSNAVLSVTVTGVGGSGIVTSSVGGIDCGSACMANLPTGTVVMLTATPNSRSTFVRWGGASCTTGPTCAVTLTADTAMTAEFGPLMRTVSVVRIGNGTGTVTSSPAGINCPGTSCSSMFAEGTQITLMGAASVGSTFLGWGGASGCTGTAPCTFTVSADTSVDARFVLDNSLSIMKSGNGTGSVVSTPIGIDCGADCDEAYPLNTMVQLQAMTTTGNEFAGFSGGGCTTGSQTCTVTMDTGKTVTATFNKTKHSLSVSRPGAGSGAVTSNPGGIMCGGSSLVCTELYDYDTVVTLTAAPAMGSTFIGWSSNCTASGLTCMITIKQMETVAATFAITQHPLMVLKEGTGVGTVSGPGIACPGDCTEPFDEGSSVTLTAQATAPSLFVGWLGACSGTGACVVTMSGARTVRAVFSPPPNRMFVTSQQFTMGNIGGLAGADAKCQAAANALSPPLAGTYRAWLSSSAGNAITRFGSASGWVRMDGKPFANTLADLAANLTFHPGRITETGADIGDGEVATGMSETGGTYAANGDCGNFSNTSGIAARTGHAGAMGSTWVVANDQTACTTQVRLYCFGVDREASVIPANPGPVRRAFMRFWTPGGGIADADAKCQADATLNNLPGNFRALLATTTQSAIGRFDTTGRPWVRVDNVPILPTAGAWANSTTTVFDSVPNLGANGMMTWSNFLHWSGGSTLTSVGTSSSTCSDWTNTAQVALSGSSAYGNLVAFLMQFGTMYQCDFNGGTIVCLQD